MNFDMSLISSLNILPNSIKHLFANPHQNQVELIKKTHLWGATQRAVLKVVDLPNLRIEEIIPTDAADNRQPYAFYLFSSHVVDTADTLRDLVSQHDENQFWVFYDKILTAFEYHDRLMMTLEIRPPVATESVVMSFVNSVWSTSCDVWPVGSRACETFKLVLDIRNHYKIKSECARLVYRAAVGETELFPVSDAKMRLVLLSFWETREAEDSLACTAGELLAVISNRRNYWRHWRPQHQTAYLLRVDANMGLVYLESVTLSTGYILAVCSGQTPEGMMQVRRSRAYDLLKSDDRLSLAHAVRGILVNLVL